MLTVAWLIFFFTPLVHTGGSTGYSTSTDKSGRYARVENDGARASNQVDNIPVLRLRRNGSIRTNVVVT
jgi:hypothetical protein